MNMKKIHFVKESQNEVNLLKNTSNEENGKEIAEQYRNLCKESTNNVTKPAQTFVSNKNREKEKSSLKFTKAYEPDDIYSICQMGNLKELNEWLLCDKFDVNRCDQFGWSPLMIACCGGHLNVIKKLLQHGANITCLCPSGRSLKEVCIKFKQYSVIRFLETYSTKNSNLSLNNETNQPNPLVSSSTGQEFECEFCGTISGTTPKIHVMSIAHQLSSRTASSSSNASSLGSYTHISKNYKGYQMLRQQGWNGTTGLGVNEDGRKYPIVVKVRQNRTAIGHTETVETHIEKIVQSQTQSERLKNINQDRIAKPKLKHKLANCDKKHRKIAARFRKSFYE